MTIELAIRDYLISHGITQAFIARKCGWSKQRTNAILTGKQMSELQKELCKHSRGKENAEQIAEEIADVQIMLDQMIILHNCENAVKEYRRSKIE